MFSLLMLFYVVTIYHSIVMRGLRYSSHLPNCLLLRRIPFAAILFRLHVWQLQRNILGNFFLIGINFRTQHHFHLFRLIIDRARGAISYCFVMTVLLSTNKMESVSKLLVSSVAFDVTFGLPSVK